MKYLSAKLFGSFSISNDSYLYPKKGAKEASQLNLLIAYLLLAQERRVSKEELINVLWENDKSQNPVGALRNLVYRARLELSKFLPDRTSECINFSRGEYFWDSQVPCHVDVLKFNILYEICVDSSSDETLRYKSAFQAMKLSRSRFLDGVEGNSWVNSYRETLFQKYICCATTVCKTLYLQCQYESLLSVCNNLYYKRHLPLDICYYYMYGLYKLEKFDELSVVYSNIFDRAFSETNPDTREKLRTVLKQAKPLLQGYRGSVHAFEYHIIHSPTPTQPVFMDLSHFKNTLMAVIQQKPTQAGRSNFLCSITLDAHDETNHKTLMDALRSVLLKRCSPTDFFTLSGRSSYALLFTAVTLQTAETVIRAVKKEMLQNYNIGLDVDYHPMDHYFIY